MKMMEFIEKHKVNYDCGCVHEIGLESVKIIGSGFWKPTGNNQDCKQHM